MLIEVKRTRAFKPDLHPRDKQGRFSAKAGLRLAGFKMPEIVPAAPRNVGNTRVLTLSTPDTDDVQSLLTSGDADDIRKFVSGLTNEDAARLVDFLGIRTPTLALSDHDLLTGHMTASLGKKARRKMRRQAAVIPDSATSALDQWRSHRMSHGAPRASNRLKALGNPMDLEAKDVLSPPPFDIVTDLGWAVLITEAHEGKVWHADDGMERRIQWLEDTGCSAFTIAIDEEGKGFCAEGLYRGPTAYMDEL